MDRFNTIEGHLWGHLYGRPLSIRPACSACCPTASRPVHKAIWVRCFTLERSARQGWGRTDLKSWLRSAGILSQFVGPPAGVFVPLTGDRLPIRDG